MMKLISVFILFVLMSSLASAEKIHLKDGRTLEAKVLQKDAQSVKIDLNGVTMTYYADEIQDIDGQPLSQPPKAVVPAVAKPTPVMTDVPKISPTTNTVSVPTEEPKDKRALILKFVEVFGTRKAMEQNFEGMLQVFEQQKPEEAKRIREGFKVDEIIERLIPLYDKYFTSEDLKAYIKFYSSTEGQKLISNIGLIMRESIAVGAEYLKEKFPDMAKEK